MNQFDPHQLSPLWIEDSSFEQLLLLFLGLAVFVSLVIFYLWLARVHAKNHYRREALLLLEKITRLEEQFFLSSAHLLIRRVLYTAYGQEVLLLSQDSWYLLLRALSVKFLAPHKAIEVLLNFAYQKHTPDERMRLLVLSFARHIIKTHPKGIPHLPKQEEKS